MQPSAFISFQRICFAGNNKEIFVTDILVQHWYSFISEFETEVQDYFMFYVSTVLRSFRHSQLDIMREWYRNTLRTIKHYFLHTD